MAHEHGRWPIRSVTTIHGVPERAEWSPGRHLAGNRGERRAASGEQFAIGQTGPTGTLW